MSLTYTPSTCDYSFLSSRIRYIQVQYRTVHLRTYNSLLVCGGSMNQEAGTNSNHQALTCVGEGKSCTANDDCCYVMACARPDGKTCTANDEYYECML